MSKPDLKERAREELRNYALVASYLYVCFAAFVLYKSALLREEGAGLLPHGLAAHGLPDYFSKLLIAIIVDRNPMCDPRFDEGNGKPGYGYGLAS